MVRRFRGRRKRFVRRRRRFGRKRMTRRRFKKTSYNGIYYAKCISHFYPQPDSDMPLAQVSFNVHWGTNGDDSINDRYINNTDMFAAYSAVFQNWRIHGYKVQIKPLQAVTGQDSSTAGAGIYDLVAGSFINQGVDPLTTNTAVLENCDDYINKSMPYGFKQYKNVGKYFRGRMLKWMNTAAGTGGETTYYPDCCTLYRMNVRGYTTAAPIAYVTVIWYVSFKGPYTE